MPACRIRRKSAKASKRDFAQENVQLAVNVQLKKVGPFGNVAARRRAAMVHIERELEASIVEAEE